jgi:MFS family permease
VATGLAIFMGWAYDVIGRQPTLILGLSGMVVFMTLMPKFGQEMSALYGGRIMFGIFTHLVIYNPLIQDFVKPISRGMGYALTISGSFLGLLMSYWLSTYYFYPSNAES